MLAQLFRKQFVIINERAFVHCWKRPIFFKMCMFLSNKRDNQMDISQENITKIKRIITQQLGEKFNEQEQFFKNQQSKLSLKIIQIQDIQQLRPLIKQYSQKIIRNASQEEKMQQLLRCEFIILYKYINLKGQISSSEIQTIYNHLSQNISLLDEEVLTKFLSIIANQITSNSDSKLRKKLPNFPKLKNASHENSQLLSFLLMIYPQFVNEIYVNYYLVPKKREKSFRQGVTQPEKQIIYSPVEMVYILNHYPYYEDIKQLTETSLSFQQIESVDVHFDDAIGEVSKLKEKQIQAICLALQKEIVFLVKKYLFSSEYLIRQISIKNCLKLLKAILNIQDLSIFKDQTGINAEEILLKQLLEKKESLYQHSEDEIIEENQNYLSIIEVITIMLTRQRKYLSLKSTTSLIDMVFRKGSTWVIRLEQCSYIELFNILTCYKGSKDYLMKVNKINIDNEHIFLKQILFHFKQQLQNEINVSPKQVFYACYFAQSFGELAFLKGERVQSLIQEFIEIHKSQQKLKKIAEELLLKRNE